MITLRIRWSGFSLTYGTGRFHDRDTKPKDRASVSQDRACRRISAKTERVIDGLIGGSA